MNGPRQFDFVTKEIVENGSIEIHSTKEDMVKLSEVNIYNQYMRECRNKMRELHILRGYYLLLNFLMVVGFMFAKYTPILILPQKNAVIIRFIVEILIATVYIVLCFIFCLWKGELKLVPNIIMTIVLLFIYSSFWFLFANNIIFLVIYRYKAGYLSKEIGYPLFYDIRIDRIRKKTYDVQGKKDNKAVRKTANITEVQNESI